MNARDLTLLLLASIGLLALTAGYLLSLRHVDCVECLCMLLDHTL